MLRGSLYSPASPDAVLSMPHPRALRRRGSRRSVITSGTVRRRRRAVEPTQPMRAGRRASPSGEAEQGERAGEGAEEPADGANGMGDEAEIAVVSSSDEGDQEKGAARGPPAEAVTRDGEAGDHGVGIPAGRVSSRPKKERRSTRKVRSPHPHKKRLGGQAPLASQPAPACSDSGQQLVYFSYGSLG